MLVLARKESQRIMIGKNITVTVVRIRGNQVRIGIEAPPDVSVDREEVSNWQWAAGGEAETTEADELVPVTH